MWLGMTASRKRVQFIRKSTSTPASRATASGGRIKFTTMTQKRYASPPPAILTDARSQMAL